MLQLLAVELRGLGSSGESLPQVAAAVDLANDAAVGWVDQAAWRAFQLLVAFFLMLLVYRLISSRLPARG